MVPECFAGQTSPVSGQREVDTGEGSGQEVESVGQVSNSEIVDVIDY